MSTSFPRDPLAPRKCILGMMIGQGSFGKVYMALNSQTGELIAVKQVHIPRSSSSSSPEQVAHKQEVVESLQKEISLLKSLNHKHIVRYLAAEREDDHLNIYLEYIPGGSIASMLETFGKFSEEMVRKYILQTLDGLAYLHDKGFVHRDIKGGNILVNTDGMVKISDFGISKRVDDDEESSSTSGNPNRASLQGSIFWMSPEVVKSSSYTKKGDIWSVGCLVIEMFIATHPFPDATGPQALFKIGTYCKPALPEKISELAKDFIEKCLQIEYEKRPTAHELKAHKFVKGFDITSND
ncbi:MEK kinase [Ramicandelaber brevisporus]|nr:MEK kinase [Ramicandelaber brevisporus]